MKKSFTLHQMTTRRSKFSTLFAAIIVLLIATSSTTVRAEEGDKFTIDNITYQITSEANRYARVYSHDKKILSGDITILASVPYNSNIYKVTAIYDHAFAENKNITSVTIPASVEKIGFAAFSYCDNLKSVTIAKGLRTIGEQAFYYCKNLSSVNIPESVTSIEKYAFSDCPSLSSFTIPSSVTSIGEKAFQYCSSLSSITIPNSVTTIEYRTFYECKNLTSVTIPSSVTSIKTEAFKYCENLTSVTIPNSVTTIESQTFYQCKKLTSVTIPSSVTSIGESAFYTCTSLSSISIPNSIKSIGSNAFKKCSSLSSINIPGSVSSIGENAFNECTSLSSITIPNSVTTIGSDAFRYCSKLTEVYLYTNPENLKWNENGCNDFKTKGNKTICHIPSNYYDTYKAKFTDVEDKYKVNVNFVGDITDLSANHYTISGITDVDYTGEALEPIVITDGDKTLIPGTDYTITYTNNINIGTATASLTGKTKLCIGSCNIEFDINKATPQYTIPTIAALLCTSKLADISLPEGFAFAANSKELTIGENKRMLVFTPKDVDHYKVVNDIEVTITLSHSYSKPTYTWSDDGKTCTATVACQNDESHDITETASISSEVTTPATTEAKGKTTYTAKFQNSIFTTQTKEVEDIDKLEVNPTNPTDPTNPTNPSTPIATITDNTPVKVWSYNSTIYIESALDAKYTIIDLNGRTIATSTTKSSKEQININHSGIYLVIIDNQSFKVSL